jgi:hypothetical protein
MILIKKYGVWLALACTLMATLWVSTQEEANELVVLNYKESAKFTQPEHKKTGMEQSKVENQVMVNDNFKPRRTDNDVPKNIFTPYVAIQNSPELNKVPTRSLPNNPFVYAGKIIEDGALVVFLIDGNKSHAVRTGDVIEDTWKIVSITPPTMILKYMPLKIELQMEIGANS